MNQNDLGKKILVEESQKIEINSFLIKIKRKLKKLMTRSDIEINGQKICLTTSKTGFNGTRYWFRCPICRKRSGVLFLHPVSQKIGCRTCLNLKYRKQVYKGMIEALPNNLQGL